MRMLFARQQKARARLQLKCRLGSFNANQTNLATRGVKAMAETNKSQKSGGNSAAKRPFSSAAAS